MKAGGRGEAQRKPISETWGIGEQLERQRDWVEGQSVQESQGNDEKTQRERARESQRGWERGDTHTHPRKNQSKLKERQWPKRRERRPERARKPCMGRGILRGRTQRKENMERKGDQERETYLPREKRETDAGIMREGSRWE